VAVNSTPSGAWLLRSWDRFVIPKPRAEVVVHFHDAIDPRQFAGDGRVERLTACLQETFR
jgi:lysophospholipid acyltransferase (LPLAT)-like uncharacterized protein